MSKTIIKSNSLKYGQLPVNKIVHGNTLDVLRKLPSNSVDCVITSPPYWAKRDYGEETIVEWSDGTRHQLGLEPTPEMFVDHLIEIFREVKRVLKPHGNVFVVIDDTYSGGGGWNSGGGLSYRENEWERTWVKNISSQCPTSKIKHIPRKSLCLVPEMFAVRMVYEVGFILRNKIIWAKKVHIYKERTTIGNAMPESVGDRLSHTWEYVYHFVKEPKYWYDLDAVRVPHKTDAVNKLRDKSKEPYNQSYPGGAFSPGARPEGHPLGANPGDVLQVNTEPFPEAHFSVYPERLVEFLIKVACPKQICNKCGKPRERIVEKIGRVQQHWAPGTDTKTEIAKGRHGSTSTLVTGYKFIYRTSGWTNCGCNAGWKPGIVLDPFLGSGTTALVALKMGRRFVGIEINRNYCEMAYRRIKPYLNTIKLTDIL